MRRTAGARRLPRDGAGAARRSFCFRPAGSSSGWPVQDGHRLGLPEERHVFLVALGALDGRWQHAEALQRKLLRAEAENLVHGALAGGFTSDHALDGFAGAELELRLDEHGSQPPALEPGHAGRKDERERDEGDVGHDEIHLFGDERRGRGPDVDAL